MPSTIITGAEMYNKVIRQIPKAHRFVWIGTADIKDMHVAVGNGSVSFLYMLNHLVQKGVEIRLLHAKEPGKNFRDSYDKYPTLWKKMERRMCPRVHFKIVVIDGQFAYTGSANLTGAGLGMKSPYRRNFEMGIITTEADWIDTIMQYFDAIWQGTQCPACGRKKFCKDPIK